MSLVSDEVLASLIDLLSGLGLEVDFRWGNDRAEGCDGINILCQRRQKTSGKAEWKDCKQGAGLKQQSARDELTRLL
jgi:hypothetical protein